MFCDDSNVTLLCLKICKKIHQLFLQNFHTINSTNMPHKSQLLLTLFTGILYFFVYNYYYNAYDRHNHRKLQRRRMIYTAGNFSQEFIRDDQMEIQLQKLFFMKYWNLQHDMRFNYNRVMEPCKNDMKWKPYYVERTPYMVTSTNYTKTSLDIKPAGQYSRLLIETYSLMNTRKYIGGDSWRTFVKGESSVPVTLLDNLDGTYELSFLILEPGQYWIELYLEYSLCDGLKDPPKDFFSKGNDQGKGQRNNALPGYEKPYLEEKFHKDISFEVKAPTGTNVYHELYEELTRLSTKPCLMLDGFGRWNNSLTWSPYLKEPFMGHSSKKIENNRGILWIYGDSIGDFFFKSIVNTALCRNVFRSCNRTYNWVYNLPHGKPVSQTEIPYTGNDFNLTRLLEEVKNVLLHPNLDENSALLINYGLHYAMGISLGDFHIMIDNFIQTLKASEGKFKGTIIWKTTTALQKWKYGTPESNARHGKSRRFLTEPRVELFNTVSSSKLCDANLKILDVFPMSYSYPNGTGWDHKPWDAVHYNRMAFRPVEQYLYEFFDVNNKHFKSL